MKKEVRICNFLMKSGGKCKNHSLKNDSNGRCFFHSELTKEQRTLSSRKGGLVRREDKDIDIDIKSAFDVTTLLNYVVRGLREGRLDSKTANSLIYACNMHLKALEVHEIQQKLKEIGEEMKQQQRYSNLPADWDCVDLPENCRLPEGLGDEGKDNL